MSKYVLAPAAEDDLLTIWHYYAGEVKDPDLADRMIGEIISGFHTVARNPGIGHVFTGDSGLDRVSVAFCQVMANCASARRLPTVQPAVAFTADRLIQRWRLTRGAHHRPVAVLSLLWRTDGCWLFAFSGGVDRSTVTLK